jgi:hypothetical protein
VPEAGQGEQIQRIEVTDLWGYSEDMDDADKGK